MENVAALAVAMEQPGSASMAARQERSNAGMRFQTELGIMPCAANAILNEKGIPVVCETDIHGAITALLVECGWNGREERLLR